MTMPNTGANAGGPRRSHFVRHEDLKKLYGDEYPAAVLTDGIRLPVHSERRFSRGYHSDEHKMGIEISRFMDGSASMIVRGRVSRVSTDSLKKPLIFANLR